MGARPLAHPPLRAAGRSQTSRINESVSGRAMESWAGIAEALRPAVRLFVTGPFGPTVAGSGGRAPSMSCG